MTVTASDGVNTSAVQAFAVTVTNVNEAPSIASPSLPISTLEDTAVTITNAQLNALVADPEFNDTPSNGSVTLSVIVTTAAGVPVYSPSGYDLASGGNVTFTPPQDYFGMLNVTLTATDSGGLTTSRTVPVTVTNINDVPVITSLPQVGAVIEDETSANATTASGQLTATDADGKRADLDADRLADLALRHADAAANGQWTFVLDQNAPATQALGVTGNLGGQALYLAQVSDGNGGTVTAPIAIAIAGNNDAPDLSAVVLADVTMPEDGTATITAAAIDAALASGSLDADHANGELTITLTVTDPATGAVIFTAIYDGGDISFTPPADYAGTLAATVTVTDPMGSSDTTGFDVIVTPVNDVPVITSLPQVGAVIEDETSANATTASGQLTATDADGNALTWTLIGSPTSPYGTLTLQPNGQWTFVLDQKCACDAGPGRDREPWRPGAVSGAGLRRQWRDGDGSDRDRDRGQQRRAGSVGGGAC